MCIVVIFIQNFRFFRFQSSGHPTSSHCGGWHRRRGSDFFLYGTTFQHEVGFSANRLSQKSNMCWINMSCNFVGCIPLHHHCIPNSRSALLLVSIGGLRAFGSTSMTNVLLWTIPTSQYIYIYISSIFPVEICLNCGKYVVLIGLYFGVALFSIVDPNQPRWENNKRTG